MSVQSESDVNSDLKKRLKQRESQLAAIQAKNSSLDEQLSELRAKLKANSDLMYEKDVQALRLVQKNELVFNLNLIFVVSLCHHLFNEFLCLQSYKAKASDR